MVSVRLSCAQGHRHRHGSRLESAGRKEAKASARYCRFPYRHTCSNDWQTSFRSAGPRSDGRSRAFFHNAVLASPNLVNHHELHVGRKIWRFANRSDNIYNPVFSLLPDHRLDIVKKIMSFTIISEIKWKWVRKMGFLMSWFAMIYWRQWRIKMFALIVTLDLNLRKNYKRWKCYQASN